MIPLPELPTPTRPRRRARWVAVALLPLLAACTLTTENPTRYNAVTEANVLDGCVAEQDESLAGLITVDEQGTRDRDDDIVEIPETIPADILDPCVCLYEGIVEDIPFGDFDDLDRALQDLPDTPDGDDEAEVDDGDDEVDEEAEALAETQATLVEIAEGCGLGGATLS